MQPPLYRECRFIWLELYILQSIYLGTHYSWEQERPTIALAIIIMGATEFSNINFVYIHDMHTYLIGI